MAMRLLSYDFGDVDRTNKSKLQSGGALLI